MAERMIEFAARVRDALRPQYAIVRELGSGGMATVYLAQDIKHARDVAVKVVRPEFAGVLGGERFVREIQIASKLSHPHVIPVYDSGQADGLLYYTMPYVEGESLRSRLNRERSVPIDEALRIAREVASALSYAHRRGVIHRDIKPENILLSDGEAIVADFGIARAVSLAGGPNLTTSGFPLGTLGYMSPEQAAGSRDLDGRTDIYSLGCVLYEMVVGKTPERWLETESLATGRVSGTTQEERLQLDSLPEPVERILVRALAQKPADRYATADEFLSVLERPAATEDGAAAPPATRARWRRRSQLVAALVVVVAAAIVGAVSLSTRSGPALDSNVLAVAPFDALSSELESWREGMVDLLSASLDGAGPLTAVPPSVAISRWEGRADPASAQPFGESVRSGLVVYGRLVGTGADSARVLASLYDATSRRVISEFDLRDRADRVDRIADSLAVGIMAELSRIRPLGIWRLASLGSSSPAAVKEFLRGEQFYRRFELDSAQFHYERAIGLDSTFALAHSRRAISRAWSLNFDPEVVPSMLRAGQLNHGLARRESLLVVADSIRGATGGSLESFRGDSAAWRAYRRLLPTLEFAAQLYPLDPEVWYQLGEARYHEGAYLGVNDEQARSAFARAVELDSSFVPAYKHLTELTLVLDGADAALEVIEANLARVSGMYADAARVARRVLDSQHDDDSTTTELLGQMLPDVLSNAWFDLKHGVDSTQAAVRVARAWAATDDSARGRLQLALLLTFRGRPREAYELVGTQMPGLFATLTRLGVVPEDSAAAVYRRWLTEGYDLGIYFALRWWLAHGDRESLERAAARWDSISEAADSGRRERFETVTRLANAYVSLASGDTTAALSGYETIPNWPACYYCYDAQLVRAQVLGALGRDQEAADLLDHMPFGRQWAPAADQVIVQLERGRVHERLGNREDSIRAFTFVLDAWRNADPEVQPAVAEASAAVRRLATEPRK